MWFGEVTVISGPRTYDATLTQVSCATVLNDPLRLSRSVKLKTGAEGMLDKAVLVSSWSNLAPCLTSKGPLTMLMSGDDLCKWPSWKDKTQTPYCRLA